MRLVFKRFEIDEPRSVNDRKWAKQALHNRFRDYLVFKFESGWAAGFCIRLPKSSTMTYDGDILTVRRGLFIALVKG